MLEKFIEEWLPKTIQWDNIGKFILESGIEITEEQNPKWLTGYTNIGKSHKPHHKDEYVRYMEESLFVLHDVVHQIFTLETECSKEEYVKRQLYGELFTFYLTEYVIPSYWYITHSKYLDDDRGCFWLMYDILKDKPKDINIIDWMWDIFIDESRGVWTINIKGLEKYRKMFQEDLENSKKNYKNLPKIKSYCMVGASSQNHIDFFEAVSCGAIKNIKRDFNLELPSNWI
jgi:hypothetical protein